MKAKRHRNNFLWTLDEKGLLHRHQGILLVVVMILLSTSLGFIRSASFFVEAPVDEDPELDHSFTQEHAWEYFQPSWTQDKGLDALNALARVHHIIDDPDKRIEEAFRVTPGLRQRVIFWIDIYTRYGSRLKVLHDKNRLNIIYGYFDFRKLHRLIQDPILRERWKVKIEKLALQELETKLSFAQSGHQDTSALRTFLLKNHLLQTKPKELVSEMRTQTGQRDMYVLALQRAQPLLPHIETVFESRGLPVGLARIPFVESSFNERAKSNQGAVGIWQFMPETAAQIIHPTRTELWSDSLVQTKAAAKLLELYRNILPDWASAVTAYNSGVGRIQKLIQKYKTAHFETILNLPDVEDLGFAGRNFFAEVLAAYHIEAYKDEIFEEWVLSPVSPITGQNFQVLAVPDRCRIPTRSKGRS